MNRYIVSVLILFSFLLMPSLVTAQWQSIPIRTQPQASAGLSGGEGFQMIFDIDYAPTNTNTVYAIVDTSQVWKSTDGGTTWARKHTGFTATGGGSLAVSPFSENVVFASAGCMETTNPDGASDIQGTFRTLDGGETWTQARSHWTKRYNSTPGGDLCCFTGSNTVYIGTADEGLWRLTNLGTNTSWTQVATPTQLGVSTLEVLDVKVTGTSTDNSYPKTLFIVTNNSTYPIRKVIDENDGSPTITTLGTGLHNYPTAIAIAGSNTTTFYAVVRNVSGQKSKVYKSTDSGANFSNITSGAMATFLNATSGTNSAEYVDVSPVDSNFVCVGCNHQEFYYSNNGTGTWNVPVSEDESNANGWVAGSLLGYNNASTFDYHRVPLALHPTNRNILLTTGEDHAIKKSTDGGQNFRYSNTGFTCGRWGFDPASCGMQSISWNTTNRFVLFLMDTGVFFTEDGGNTFKNLKVPNNYNQHSTMSGAISPTTNSQIIVTASGDWSTQKIEITRNAIAGTTTNPTWTRLNGTDAKYQLIGWGSDANTVYAGNYRFDNIETNNIYGTLTKTVEAIYSGNRDIVYSIEASGANTRVFKSTNKGATWTNPYVDLPDSGTVTNSAVGQVAIAPNNPDRIYLTRNYTGMHIYDSGSWTTANTGLDITYLQFVAVDPLNPNIVYAGQRPPTTAGQGDGIYRSEDYGMTWTNIGFNLNPITAWGIIVNPYDSYVYMGSHYGTLKYPPPGASGTGTPGAPPIVSTGTATAVTVTTATLNGTVNSLGSSTTVRFQYGTASGNYTTNTGSQTVSAGTSSVEILQAITGLIGSTTYYTRVQANSANGSTNGSETTFSTLNKLSFSALMGTPTVNGSLSDWPTLVNPISKTISGTGTEGIGTWHAFNNASGLYVAFAGSDTALYADSGITNVYNDDGFEIYIDRDYNLGTTYDAYDFHLGWNYHGTFTRAYNGTTTGITVGTSSASGGYIMEVFIPWSIFPGGIVPSGTTTIGFDIQCNGDSNGGSRDIAKDWNASGDTNYFNPSTFGEMILTSTASGGSDAGTETVASPIGTISGCILYLKMDEATGSSTADSSGNGNGGTLTGEVRWGTSSIGMGSSTFYNGSTGTLTVGSPALLDGVVPISLTANIRPITMGEGTDGRIFTLTDTNGTTTGRLLVGMSSNNSFYFNKHFVTTSLNIETGTNSIVLDKWQPIAITFNGSATTTDSHLYIGGVEYSANPTNGVGSQTTRNTASWVIGNTYGDTKTFHGWLDDMRIYNKILSVQEVLDLATVGSVTVTVGSATSITQTGAILNGTVTPNGSSTFNGYFRIGTQTNIYTGTSTEQLIGTGSTPVALSRLSGTLTASTTYFIAPVAYNAAGIHIKGSETSFTTTGADAASPTGTITINSNGTYTTAIEVTLNLSATDDIGVTGYYLSGSTTTPTAGQAGWISVGTITPYSANIPYTLTTSDGTKTVYVWYKDGVNNVSAVASDSIILDTTFTSIIITSPSATYTYNGGKAFGTSGSTVLISGSSTDTNLVTSVTISNNNTTTVRTATGTQSWSSTERIIPYMDNGLVFYVRRDEATGTTVRDSSRYASHGTATNSAGTDNAHFGRAGYYNGVNAYDNFGNPNQVNFGTTSSLTYCCWVYPTAYISSRDSPLGKGANSVAAIGFNMELGSGAWVLNISQGTGTYRGLNVISDASTYLNKWTLVTGVVNRSSQNLLGFVNGTQVGTLSISVGSGTLSGTSLLTIGMTGSSTLPYKGNVDDVRIYNYALTNQEVLNLYNATSPDILNTFSATAQDTAGNQGTDTIHIGAFPAVTTDFATAITNSSANLVGTCNANFNTTTAYFEYGLYSGDYTGSSTTGTVTGNSDTVVNISLGALNTETTYYYRIVGSNTVGITRGEEFSFDTLTETIINTNEEYQYRSQFHSTRFREFLKKNDIYLIFMKKMKNSEDWDNLVNDPDGFLSDLVNTPNP